MQQVPSGVSGGIMWRVVCTLTLSAVHRGFRSETQVYRDRESPYDDAVPQHEEDVENEQPFVPAGGLEYEKVPQPEVQQLQM